MNTLKLFKSLILSVFFTFYSNISKVKQSENIEQVKIGNFALRVSQQPGPMIGFGQNIVEKKDLILYNFIDDLVGVRKNFFEIAPSLLYGISDSLSLFIEFPYAVRFRENNCIINGLEDVLMQFEYAFYTKETEKKVNQLTMVTAVSTSSTGLSFTFPQFQFGSPSFFLGLTASHVDPNWYYFFSTAGIFTTTINNTKAGNQFLYQFGLSKNISYKPDEYMLNWMIELDGVYAQRNEINCKIDKNSGGHQLLLGPSFWYSTPQLICQGGISWVVFQKLFGKQNKDKFLAALNIGWKF